MPGKVWLVTASEQEIPIFQAECKVGNIIRTEHGAELRIISEEKPSQAAVAAKPNLEDLYLYFFEEDQDAAIAQV